MIDAPHFDFDNLPVGNVGYMDAVIAEQQRVCGPIDERLKVLEAEFQDLVAQEKRIQKELQTAGFFRSIARTFDLGVIERKMERNQALRHTLYDARWRRTLG